MSLNAQRLHALKIGLLLLAGSLACIACVFVVYWLAVTHPAIAALVVSVVACVFSFVLASMRLHEIEGLPFSVVLFVVTFSCVIYLSAIVYVRYVEGRL